MNKSDIKNFDQAYKIGCNIFNQFGDDTNMHHCAGILSAIDNFMSVYLPPHEYKTVKSFIEGRNNE